MLMAWLWIITIVLEIATLVVLVRLWKKLETLWQWAYSDRHQQLQAIKNARLNARDLKHKMTNVEDAFNKVKGMGGWKTKIATTVIKKIFKQN